MAMITTDVQMLLGGNSEPAYHLTITALPSEIAATKNKRSTHLIQDFIQDTLQISPKRGVVRFDAVPEENLATNGVTALQEIEQLERQSTDEDGMLRALSRQRSRRSKKSGAPAFTERFRAGLPSIRSTTPYESALQHGRDDSDKVHRGHRYGQEAGQEEAKYSGILQEMSSVALD